jgi:Na+/H+ antiporter NhaD/arsenite permease-like protein
MVRSFVRALLAGAVFVVLTAVPALAQAPTEPKGGHPWHWWMAIGALAIGGLTLLGAVAGFLVQAPGFRKVQHKQGQPR